MKKDINNNKHIDLELYVHIPFCVRKCNYCDFVSFAGREDLYDAYVDALCEEIRRSAGEFPGRNIVSVYIGGGTPSVLSCEQISRLVNTLKSEFSVHQLKEKRRGLKLQKIIRPAVEFSIEVNPGTVDKEKLSCYHRLGINRLSIGLQSTDAQDLKTLGRIHSYDDFVDTFESTREAGFHNMNVDLMQAIPGQTLAGWKRVLAIVGTWKPEHISAYSLIVEDGTPFGKLKAEGKLALPDEDTEREIYYYTKEFLEKAQYHRYEISNYALPGYECIHNKGYWTRTEYLGLGLNSSSMIGNVRWKNTTQLKKYISFFGSQSIDKQTLADSVQNGVREEIEELSRKDQMEEFVFLGLRMTEGISLQEFLDTFHQDFEFTYGDNLRRLTDLGMLERRDDRIRLTEYGIDVSNKVFAELLTTADD